MTCSAVGHDEEIKSSRMSAGRGTGVVVAPHPSCRERGDGLCGIEQDVGGIETDVGREIEADDGRAARRCADVPHRRRYADGPARSSDCRGANRNDRSGPTSTLRTSVVVLECFGNPRSCRRHWRAGTRSPAQDQALSRWCRCYDIVQLQSRDVTSLREPCVRAIDCEIRGEVEGRHRCAGGRGPAVADRVSDGKSATRPRRAPAP